MWWNLASLSVAGDICELAAARFSINFSEILDIFQLIKTSSEQHGNISHVKIYDMMVKKSGE